MNRIEPTRRVEMLREQAFQSPMMAQVPIHSQGLRRELLLTEGWIAAAAQPTTRLRRAASQAYCMDHMRVVINDHELIVGCPDFSDLTEDEQTRFDQVCEPARKCVPPPRGIYDHMAMDYEKLIKVGVDGLVSEAKQRRKGLNLQVPENVAKDEFYCGCLMELDALLRLVRRYAERARTMAADAPPERGRELLEIADILDRVPAQPAKTFRQALQSIHFYTFMLRGDYQMGRPDQYLIDRYRADVAAGTLTPQSALELIDCFCLLYSTYHPKGSAVGFMVGGRDRTGNPVNNELTGLFIQSIAHTRMAYPSIGLCVHDETPDELLDMAVDMLCEGYSHPAIFNDKAITRGLLELGMPEHDAHLYVHSACVEITVCGKSGGWVFSPVINPLPLLLDVMGDSPGCDSVAAFMEAFEHKLRRKLVDDVHLMKMWQLERSRNGYDSLLSSCLVDDCLKLGKGVEEGGASYNFIMPAFIGLANLVDSIAAVKALVFDAGELTMAEFHRIAMDDFRDHEPLRQRIVNRLPHFGNSDPLTDSLMREITQMIVRSCEGSVTLWGTRAVPGTFSYLRHVRDGRTTPATPDGRKAGTSLAAAASPTQGREVSGPTAAILSATCWDQIPFMGGVAINLKFQPLGDSTRETMKAVTTTFLDRGGLQLQVNCVSQETLLDARAHPERHRDLLVRIAGYSDYFVALSPEMQDEIVARTGHE